MVCCSENASRCSCFFGRARITNSNKDATIAARNLSANGAEVLWGINRNDQNPSYAITIRQLGKTLSPAMTTSTDFADCTDLRNRGAAAGRSRKDDTCSCVEYLTRSCSCLLSLLPICVIGEICG